MKKIMATMIALVLLGAMSLYASQTATSTKPAKSASAAAKAPKTKVASGTVVSASDTELVVAEKSKGKEENVTYKLNDSTKKSGDLAAGNKVTVHYNTQGSDNVATMVRARAPKAMAKAHKPAK